MASVRKKKGSANWFACFVLPTGHTDGKGRAILRRVQRSTGLTDRERALQVAITYERAARAAVEKRWVESSARRFLAEINALAGVRVAEVEPANVFLRRWVNGRKSSLAKASFERYEGVVEAFILFLGDEAGVPILDVTPLKIAGFRDAETAAGKTPSTVNKSLMVLRQAFAEAQVLLGLDRNPADELNVKNAKKARQKRRAFTFDQFRLLVDRTSPDYRNPDAGNYKDYALDPDWRTLVMLCGYTGGRQQEVAQLRWEQVDLKGRRLTLVRTKTSDEHWLPIHPALQAHLEARWADKGRSQQVLPYLSTLQRRRISNAFRVQILPRIGIKQEYANRGGKGRTLAEYSVHSLRHSLSTWLEDAGVSEMMRMRIVGHEDEGVSRGYTHTELTRAAAEMAKVPAV